MDLGRRRLKTAYCFGLEGTLTRTELMPVIAEEVDLREEFDALTMAMVGGILSFPRTLRLGCRLLQDVPLTRVQDIVASVPLHAAIADFINRIPEQCLVVTGHLDAWVRPLEERIRCDWHCSIASTDGQVVRGIEAMVDKGAVVRSLRQRFDRIVAIGDGMGDVPMFEEADVAVAFGATHDPIQTLVEYSTHVIYDEGALCRFLTTQ